MAETGVPCGGDSPAQQTVCEPPLGLTQLHPRTLDVKPSEAKRQRKEEGMHTRQRLQPDSPAQKHETPWRTQKHRWDKKGPSPLIVLTDGHIV